MRRYTLLVGIGCMLAARAAASPWADVVISYDPGDGTAASFRDAQTSLGPPSRTTGGDSDVTVFNSPFLADQIVSIGTGGHLRVGFDEPVVDDPANPFGIDLLIFGNALLFTDSESAIAGIFSEPASIHLSQDGTTFFEVPGVFADGLFPTQGFLDTSDPFGGFAVGGDGTLPSDFLLPVDPALGIDDLIGLTYAQTVALYAGSGGGAGVDIGAVGLDWVQYVEVRGLASAAEIDAFADVAPVPEPRGLASRAAALALGLLALRRRRTGL